MQALVWLVCGIAAGASSYLIGFYGTLSLFKESHGRDS